MGKATGPSNAHWSAWRTSWRRRSGAGSPPLVRYTLPTVIPPLGPFNQRGTRAQHMKRSSLTTGREPVRRARPSATAVAGRLHTNRSTAQARRALAYPLTGRSGCDQRPRPLALEEEGEVEEQGVGRVGGHHLHPHWQAVDQACRYGDGGVAAHVGGDGQRPVVLGAHGQLAHLGV